MKENRLHSLQALRDSLLSGEMPQTLRWNHAVNLIEHLGQVEGHGDNEFVFAVGAQRATFKRPDNHELGLEDVSRLRKLLRQAGGPQIVLREPAQPSRIIVVIDHHAAHIYRDFAGSGAASEYTVRPHNTFNVRHPGEEREGEKESFYEAVARELKDALEIVILGHGRGEGQDASSLNKYLQSHYPDLYGRVVATENAPIPAVTDAEIESLARKYMVPLA